MDQTPGRAMIGETPTPGRFGLLGETPGMGMGKFGETPTPKRFLGGSSKWDDSTPLQRGQ